MVEYPGVGEIAVKGEVTGNAPCKGIVNQVEAQLRVQLPAVGCGRGKTHEELRRGLMQAAHGEEPPLVADPFAGGGLIPLEALRLGCEAFASDLNPVACLTLKVMLEDIPRHGPRLADELRKVGGDVKRQAERCEAPNCGSASGGAAIPCRALRGKAAARRIPGIRATDGQGSTRRHGSAGDLSVLRRSTAAGTGAGAACRAARRGGLGRG